MTDYFNHPLQKAEKYTILVEAKDRGEVVQLSSTCTNIINIEDGNNHLPVFTGQTVGKIILSSSLYHKMWWRYLLKYTNESPEPQLYPSYNVPSSWDFILFQGAGSIKERDSGDVPILRLQVSDQDTIGTEAWKAKYTIHGDKDQNFRITTDPDTNEGVLFVEKVCYLSNKLMPPK